MWYSLLLLGYKPVQHVTVLSTVGNCNTVVSIIIHYYNIMGPPSYMRSVVDRNFNMRRMTVLCEVLLPAATPLACSIIIMCQHRLHYRSRLLYLSGWRVQYEGTVKHSKRRLRGVWPGADFLMKRSEQRTGNSEGRGIVPPKCRHLCTDIHGGTSHRISVNTYCRQKFWPLNSGMGAWRLFAK